MKYALIFLLALLLPLGIAVWIFLLPDLTAPWLALFPTAGIIALGSWPIHRLLKRIPHLEDHALSFFLAVVYLIIPAGAITLLLNQSLDWSARTTRQAVVDRYPRKPDGAHDTWIFLWADDHIEKWKVSPADPIYLCQPGDSVEIHFFRGLLGLEYRDHADRIQ